MNVTKMRHQIARTAEEAERDEHRRWLARMTPEHRARHTGFAAGFPCSVCMARGWELFAAQVRGEKR